LGVGHEVKKKFDEGILYFTSYPETNTIPGYTSIDAKETGLYFLTRLLYWAL
jgi:hypothetical protein